MKKLLFIIPFLLLTSCGEKEQEQEPTIIDYINICVSAQFYLTHEETEIIVQETTEKQPYYITDILYRKSFENNVYETKYISVVDSNKELNVREIKK